MTLNRQYLYFDKQWIPLASRPRQIRGLDARPQKSLGAFDAADGAAPLRAQLVDVLWRAGGQVMLGLGPDEFIWIELQRVSREAMDPEPFLLSQKRLNVVSSVDGASSPKKSYVAAPVTLEVPKERQDFLAGEVGRVELDIQSPATTGGRDGDSRHRRDPVPLVAVPEQRGRANLHPRLGHSGDKQEAAFIEKDEVSGPCGGLFV